MSVRRIYERSFDEDDGKTINRETCPECDGALRTVGGETTCEECGLIADEYRIDHSATQASYPDEETTEQTGSPLSATRHDRGLSTEIGSWRDGRGNELSSAKRRKFSRLRRHHGSARYRSKAERNLIVAFTEIGRLTSALDLPYSVREQACTYFRTVHREDLIRGRSIDSVAAASVYAACRCGNCTRVLAEVADVASCEEQALRNRYRFLNAALELEAKPPLPTEFVPRLATACNVPDRVQHRAVEYATQTVDANLHVGRQPVGLAAASLYLAAEDDGWFLTQTRVADVADVTATTIRTRARELRVLD